MRGAREAQGCVLGHRGTENGRFFGKVRQNGRFLAGFERILVIFGQFWADFGRFGMFFGDCSCWGGGLGFGLNYSST